MSDPKYARGDVRRLFRLALAMSEIESPTLVELSRETGHHKQTVKDDMPRMTEQLGMKIEKRGYEYHLLDWGPVIKKDGVKKFLRGQNN